MTSLPGELDTSVPLKLLNHGPKEVANGKSVPEFLRSVSSPADCVPVEIPKVNGAVEEPGLRKRKLEDELRGHATRDTAGLVDVNLLNSPTSTDQTPVLDSTEPGYTGLRSDEVHVTTGLFAEYEAGPRMVPGDNIILSWERPFIERAQAAAFAHSLTEVQVPGSFDFGSSKTEGTDGENEPTAPDGDQVFVFTATSPTPLSLDLPPSPPSFSPALPPPPPPPPPPLPGTGSAKGGRGRRNALGICLPPGEAVVPKGKGVAGGGEEMGVDEMAVLAQQLQLESDNVSGRSHHTHMHSTLM